MCKEHRQVKNIVKTHYILVCGSSFEMTQDKYTNINV